MEYYTLPFRFEKVSQGKKHCRCNTREAIQQFIDLIIFTTLEQYRGDEKFGCEIWNKEFEFLPMVSKWQTEIKRSIMESLVAHEPRLENLALDIRTSEANFLRKEVDIKVHAKIKLTGEAFEHQKIIYLCPKSVE